MAKITSRSFLFICALISFYSFSFATTANLSKDQKKSDIDRKAETAPHETHTHAGEVDHDDHDDHKDHEGPEDHENHKSEKSSTAEDHNHTDEKDHKDESGGHGHHEEENESIGPEKGITEFDEEKGFKLSPEAIKNFGLSYLKLNGKGPWIVPNSAVLYSGEEVNLYRSKNGFFKRIDFKQVSKEKINIKITSSDLVEGDEIVIEGVSFLRAAEIVATGGAPEGHSH